MKSCSKNLKQNIGKNLLDEPLTSQIIFFNRQRSSNPSYSKTKLIHTVSTKKASLKRAYFVGHLFNLIICVKQFFFNCQSIHSFKYKAIAFIHVLTKKRI